MRPHLKIAIATVLIIAIFLIAALIARPERTSENFKGPTGPPTIIGPDKPPPQ